MQNTNIELKKFEENFYIPSFLSDANHKHAQTDLRLFSKIKRDPTLQFKLSQTSPKESEKIKVNFQKRDLKNKILR